MIIGIAKEAPFIDSVYVVEAAFDPKMESFIDYNSNLFVCNVQADEKMDREYQRSLITDEPLKQRVSLSLHNTPCYPLG